MSDGASESLPVSSPPLQSEGGDGDGVPGGDDTASPVFRCPSSTGMGSYCEDGKLEGESVLGDGEALLDEGEVNGGGGERSLEAELGEDEVKGVNFGGEAGEGECQGVRGVEGESRHLEQEKAQEVQIADNDCVELVTAVQDGETVCSEALGVEEGNGHICLEQAADVGVSKSDFEGCEAVTQSASEMVDISTEVADNGPSSDSENGNGKLFSVVQEGEEECHGVLEVREENAHLALEQPVEVGIAKKEFDSANGDDQTLVVEIVDNRAHVDSGSGRGDFILGEKADKEENEQLRLAQELVVEAPEPVGVTDAVVFVKGVSGSGKLDSGRREAAEEFLGISGVEEEIRHLGLKQTLAVEVPKSVAEEEHYEFPGRSPLRTLETGDLGCSVFGIGSEVRFLSSGVFDSKRVRNRCEDSELLVSSGLAADCPLVKISRDDSKPADGHCFPYDASQDLDATCMVEKCEKLCCLGAEKGNFGQCNGNELDGNGEGGQFSLKIGQRLSLQYVRSQKEHCGDNISGPYSICPKEIAGGGEVGCSVQGSPDEVSFPAVHGWKPSHFSTYVENLSSKLSSSPERQGSEVDVFIGMSACSSNVIGGEADNGGRRDPKSSPTIVLRRSNPKRGASLRSNLADNQLCGTRNNRRNGRKTVDISSSFLLSAIKISDKLKKKRSWPHRRACSSVWGPVDNLIKIFNQNVIPANYDAEKILIQNKRSKKERPIVVNKKHIMSQKDGKFQVSSAKYSATSVQPVCHIVGSLPTADCQMGFGNFNKVEAEHELAGDEFFVVTSHKQDGQLGDKDMESTLTQEASVELGECPGVSSQIAPEMSVETVSDRNSQDPGTSPDSDVYHPVIDVCIMTTEDKSSSDQPIGSKDGGVKTSEGAISAKQFSGMGENVPIQGAVFKDGLHSAVSTCSKACVTPLSVQPLDPYLCAKAKKGKANGQIKEKQCLSEHLSIVEKLPESENMNKTKKPSKGSKSKLKKRDVINEKNRSCSKSMKKRTMKGSKCMSYAMESSVPETAKLECLEESSMVQNCLGKCVLPVQDACALQSEALLQTDKTKGHKLSRGTKPGVCKGRSHRRETAGQRRQNAHQKMGKRVQESDNRCQDKSQTADASVGPSDHLSFFSGTVNPTLTMSTPQNCKTNVGSGALAEDVSNLDMMPLGDLSAPNGPTNSLEQPLPPQVAWVLCDECEKWRCISVELANILEETKCKWTCKDNTDKAFADCSMPQEKSNSEINAELGISDEEDPSSLKASANDVEPSKLADVAASQRASWIPIKSNLFLRRNRRTQTIDEIMVCHCKPLQDGHRGCGDQCLNRMLNIECVKGTCPCGDLCSNQRFQKRKYAKFMSFRCGKKGYGLQLQQDVSRGQFLIEYVGEVLDLSTYEKRQRDYASRGQKHFYFMTLNGGEVIDACTKGNLGRFINHSCEPNCRTEKWMVNGEVCIGLFAIRDIKKGEEVTFDYNYVRVVGAAAKKCVCGSSECRGYIGGDPLNSEVIVQGDSDEEDIEPAMVRENSHRELNQNDYVSNTNDVKIAKHKELSIERKDIVGTFPPMISGPEVSVRNEDDVCRLIPDGNLLDISLQSSDSMQLENTISRPLSGIQPLGGSKLSLNSVQVEENVCKPISKIQQEEISLQTPITVNEVSSDSVLYSKKLITNLIEEKPNAAKPHSVTKSSCSRGTIKRGRSNVKSLISHKTKTATPGAGTSHSEGVEEKLNVLLDVDGGISKQKDATRGYLKLLFVTAAEGDVGGCGSQKYVEGHRTQSTRDLSLILDAVLKTKSRKVLMDIINKNGLQMLHNIMKQNRGNFNRIPIIRKLLKVFEFLAHEEILTSELINKAPPCDGIESFKESILKLANHNDKQIHKIAREFRDKHIPRIRRVEPTDRDGGHLDRQIPYRCWIQSPKRKYQQVQFARDTDAIVISAGDHLPASSSELDTPGDTFPYIQQASISASMIDNSSASGIKTRKRKSRWDHPSGITNADAQSLWAPEDQSLEAGMKFIKSISPSEQAARIEVSKQTYGSARDGNSSWGEIASSQDLMQLDDERPPGFLDDEGPPGFLDKGPPGFLDDEGPPGFLVDEGTPKFEPFEKNHHSHLSSETALVKGEVLMGHPQEIYLSYMTMSYGIPVGLMQQLGTPETGSSPCNQNWTVAPGMPFYPFPPLPSYPRGQPKPREERQRVHPASGTDLTLPSTSGGGPIDMVEAGCRNSQFHGRLRWDNHGCGRRFHHPQRWNNQRFQRFWPRWPYQRFGRGFRGNARNGPSNLEVGNMRRDFEGGLCPPDGVNNNGGLSSNFHQLHN